MAMRIVNSPPSSVWIRNASPLALMASSTAALTSLETPCIYIDYLRALLRMLLKAALSEDKERLAAGVHALQHTGVHLPRHTL